MLRFWIDDAADFDEECFGWAAVLDEAGFRREPSDAHANDDVNGRSTTRNGRPGRPGCAEPERPYEASADRYYSIRRCPACAIAFAAVVVQAPQAKTFYRGHTTPTSALAGFATATRDVGLLMQVAHQLESRGLADAARFVRIRIGILEGSDE